MHDANDSGGKLKQPENERSSIDGSEVRQQRIAIVGSPNVGKSVLFNALSKQYVAVSNYPGTTVEVSRGQMRVDGEEVEIIDTPGMYSLFPITEEEHVARRILMVERPDVVMHVVDAKNLERMLPMTLQLREAGMPLVLVLNMMDEAERDGIRIDAAVLQEALGLPAVPTVSTTGAGLDDLQRVLRDALSAGTEEAEGAPVKYDADIEDAVREVISAASIVARNSGLSERTLALLLLRGDDEAHEMAKQVAPANFTRVQAVIDRFRAGSPEPLDYRVAVHQKDLAHRIAQRVVTEGGERTGLRDKLSMLMMHPVIGFPILFAVLYLGLYKFVGTFGAGTVVDFLEGTVFEEHINPVLVSFFSRLIPWPILSDLLVGEYGVLTLGFRYAVALILPIVSFFFLVFAVIEDTGYLPRLAMLIDRTFKKIGLSGRAVIPMVLGLGCATMATMVTRTLPTKRERVISTLLLALAVPCSAQLGVILALMEGRPKAVSVWAAVVILVFLLIGFLAARVLPGEGASFYIEIPPLRWPKLSNVVTKTFVRVKWYFKEVLPLFLFASVMIWLGQITRLFDLVVALLERPVRLIGLPDEAAEVFLFGFFRRDYGAAGLYDLNKAGALDGIQLVVACVALTLFLPCIAQFLMNVKERGWKTGVGISIFILLFSFGVAFVLNALLRGVGASL